jgi:hypothetical protein
MLSTVLCLFLGTFVLYVAKVLLTRRLGLPPGPRPMPVLGNISDLPPSGTPDWIHWLKYKEAYGLLL